MIKIFSIFIIFIAILLTVWTIIDNNGIVTIEWLDYHIETSFIFAILTILFIVLVFSFIFNIFSLIRKIPKAVTNRLQEKHYKKTTNQMLEHLTLISTSDKNKAEIAVNKSNFLNIGFEGNFAILYSCLAGQVARLANRHDIANSEFNKVVLNKNNMLLGYKGLIESSLDQEKYLDAMIYAENLLKYSSKNLWLLEILFDLYLRLGFWIKAEKFLQKIINLKKSEEVEKHKKFYHLYISALKKQGETEKLIENLEKAEKLGFADFEHIEMLVDLYKSQDKIKNAYNLLQKSWSTNKNSRCFNLVIEIFKNEKPAKIVEKLENLFKIDIGDLRYSTICFAKSMINLKNYNKALLALENLPKNNKDFEVAQLMLVISAQTNSKISEISYWADLVKFE